MYRLFLCFLCTLALAPAGNRAAARQAQPNVPAGAHTPAAPAAIAPLEPSPPRSPRNANYRIEVTLDHGGRTLAGRETLRWRNISTQTATELQFHLYWNAWRDRDSTWMRERRLAGTLGTIRDDAWGSIDISSIRLRHPDGAFQDVTPHLRFVAPDDGNAKDRTVMTIPIATAAPPNAVVEVEIEWRAKVPRTFARTGYVGDYYFIAHWFPKIGVLEDDGWNTHQFHSATEFFADYGTYDVSLTVPEGFVVGASGREVGRIENGDGTSTHRYQGEDIHDFAWTASPRFIESRRAFRHPALPPVEMRLLLQPEHAGQEDRHFTATADALKYYGEWFGPYPYDVITIVDPAYQSGSGGMEYPTIFTAGARWIAPVESTVPEAVIIHEAGHQFWHGIVGTNEFEHAWMDEGLTTFTTARVIEEAGLALRRPAYGNHLTLRYFGGFIPWALRDIRLSRETDGNRLPGYRGAAEADVPATPTFRYWPETASAISYNKTSLWLHTLERHLGWPVLRRILSTYFERWKFQHPEPEDFFEIVTEVSGQDLTWFVDQTYRSSNVFDYGIQQLVSDRHDGGYRTTVVARRFGEATFPVDVVTTFENGEQVRERWDGLDRRAVYVYEKASRARTAQIDPQRVLLLDVNYANNSRSLQPRGEEAAMKWSLKWMLWLQELMLTYAFFV